VTTVADGVVVRVPVPAALEWMSEFVDDMVLIDDVQRREALRIALAAHNLTSSSISAPDACFDTTRSVTCMAARLRVQFPRPVPTV
jgi:threonine dehydratase